MAMMVLVVGASALNLHAPVRAPRAAVARSPFARMEAPAVAEPAPMTKDDIQGVVVRWKPSYSSPAFERVLKEQPELGKVIRRAEFWANETATTLEIINVVGRWRKHTDIKERTTFTQSSYRDEDLAQAGTEKRYKMALKLGCSERYGLIANAPNLPFTDEKLAASIGLTCEDFAEMPVTEAACNVVYDALAESRSGLIPYAVADERRDAWVNDDGSLNLPRFLIGLAKSRMLVIIAWFVFGKGNFVWVLVAAQALHDARPDIFPTVKELRLDKVGFFF